MEEALVDAAAEGGLVLGGQRVLHQIPGRYDEREEGQRRNDEVFDGGVLSEGIDVHAEEAGDEGERQEDEGYPAEAPHGEAELERVPRVADADTLVHEV